MEQDVKENEVLLLRFKYHSFFDLNPKVRPISNATQFNLPNRVTEDICRGRAAPENNLSYVIVILTCRVYSI